VKLLADLLPMLFVAVLTLVAAAFLGQAIAGLLEGLPL
jgi:hypothetical protein